MEEKSMRKKIISIFTALIIIGACCNPRIVKAAGADHISYLKSMKDGYISKGYWVYYSQAGITNDPNMKKTVYGYVWFNGCGGKYVHSNTVKYYLTTLADSRESPDDSSWRFFNSKWFRTNNIGDVFDSRKCTPQATLKFQTK